MWRFNTTLIFIIIIIIFLTVKWDTLSPGLDSFCPDEIHEWGGPGGGASTWEAFVSGLWGMAEWGSQLVKPQGATEEGNKVQSLWWRWGLGGLGGGDLIRVVTEGVGALKRFQQGLWWFGPEAMSEVRIAGLSCCFSYINDLCSHTYIQ